MVRCIGIFVFGIALSFSLPTKAQELSGHDLVVAYNTGGQFNLAPGIFVPTRGGDIGFSLLASFGYGFEVGPTILVPGITLEGFFPSGYSVLATLGTAKLIFPIGAFAPFISGGAGPAWITEPSENGTAVMMGVGFTYYFSQSFALGAQGSYQTITGTGFSLLSAGPILYLSF